MDIRQLEAFVYTVKYQSFSLAAQKLYISQPTVSAHIRSLEEEFHTQLLKRTTKSLSLTPAGTKLYSYATEILTLQQKAIAPFSRNRTPFFLTQTKQTIFLLLLSPSSKLCTLRPERQLQKNKYIFHPFH